MSKIAYIGHSFHEKTGSTVFFIDLLKREYQVELIPNDSWSTGSLPDVSHLDDSYAAVVIFQLISEELLARIATRNVVYVPMADYIINGIDKSQPGVLYCRPYSFWEMLAKRGVRVLNFSNCIHALCVNLGVRSSSVQYYPQPFDHPDFGEGLGVFYWERGDSIQPDTVSALMGDSISSIHHHRAHDPGQCRSSGSKKSLPFNKTGLTSSSWFANKEEYLSCVRAKDIYIAPRIFEGIGMSFLEAMAMGKAVIAPDYPTMNEYIRDRWNGYLFDPDNPKAIDFNRVVQIRRNAYDSIAAGRERWLKQSEAIVDWIANPLEERRAFPLINIYRDIGLKPNDRPRISVGTLEYPERPAEAGPKESAKQKRRKSIVARILRRIGNTTLRELVSPKFYYRIGSKVAKAVGRRLAKRWKAKAIPMPEAPNTNPGWPVAVAASSQDNLSSPKRMSLAARPAGKIPSGPVRQARSPGAGLRIVVSSNCQTGGIAAALQALLPAASVEAVPALANSISNAEAPKFVKALKHADAWLTVARPELPTENGLKHLRTIRVPGVLFRAFHPDLVYARNMNSGQLISQDVHYNSFITLWCWMRGFSVEETLEVFNATIIEKLGYTRMWDPCIEALKSSFGASDIDFKRFIARIKRMGVFMHSINHPFQAALTEIAAQAAEMIDPSSSGIDLAVCDPLADTLRHSIWPLYPPIADAMSLRGSYSWRLADRHYPDLESFVRHSYSIYETEGVDPKTVKFEFIQVDQQIAVMEKEFGGGK
jgi:hypothetical protein